LDVRGARCLARWTVRLVGATSRRDRSDEELGAKVRASFIGSDRTYGAWRVWRDLLSEGIPCGLHRIERLMRLQALKPVRADVDCRPICVSGADQAMWDNAAMESFFSSLKTERTARKTYRTREDAKADVFDYIERFYNAKRRHSTIGCISPMEFERQAGLAQAGVNRTGCRLGYLNPEGDRVRKRMVLDTASNDSANLTLATLRLTPIFSLRDRLTSCPGSH
jgi:putative transposase